MEKYYSKIIGTPVFLEQGGRPLCRVTDLLIDPENGKIVAFGVAPNFKKIIAPFDVRQWTSQIVIQSYEDIVEVADLLRAEQVLAMNKPIFNNSVVSQEGELIGRVYDYVVDDEMLVLKKIIVAKSILGLLRFNQRIIPHSAIYEILPKKIIVKTDAEVFEEEAEAKKALKLDPA